MVDTVSQATEQTPTEAMFSADEASRGLGIELVEHGEGTALVRMTVTPAMVNGHRIAHGGSFSCWPTPPSPAPATATGR